jgi:hypothetical protein
MADTIQVGDTVEFPHPDPRLAVPVIAVVHAVLPPKGIRGTLLQTTATNHTYEGYAFNVPAASVTAIIRTINPIIARYVELRQALPIGDRHIKQFYLHTTDDIIHDAEEQELIDYDALRTLYQQWWGEMTLEQQDDLRRYTYSLNSANQNFLLYEIEEF